MEQKKYIEEKNIALGKRMRAAVEKIGCLNRLKTFDGNEEWDGCDGWMGKTERDR